MKKILLILILVLVTGCKKEFKCITKTPTKLSIIDSLNSELAVQNFMFSHDSLLKGFKLKTINQFTHRSDIDSIGKLVGDSLKINKSYYKADLDNNGYTDLLTIGDFYDNNLAYVFAFLYFGKDSIKTINIKAIRHSFVVPKITMTDCDNILEIHRAYYSDFVSKAIVKEKKPLIFKYNGFIEYNENPQNYKIEKIEFSTTGCFGTCPVFEMEINNDKLATFKPHYYNFSKESTEEKGSLHTRIKDDEFQTLINLCNYTNFPDLRNEYSVSWTDDQTSTLKITYLNGKSKVINDYGLAGSYGLKRIYELIYDLRKNQTWK